MVPEKGRYLALDLGGTNYRVLLVHLKGDQSPPAIQETTYAIPKHIMTGTGKEVSLHRSYVHVLRESLSVYRSCHMTSL